MASWRSIRVRRASASERRDPGGRQWYFDFFRQRNVAEPIVNAIPELFLGLFLDRNPHLTAEERDFYVGMFSRPGTADAVIWDYRLALEEDPAYWRARSRGRAQDHHPRPLDLGRIRPLGERGTYSPHGERWQTTCAAAPSPTARTTSTNSSQPQPSKPSHASPTNWGWRKAIPQGRA